MSKKVNNKSWEDGYEVGYNEALEKKYGIAMSRIIKATKSLTIKELEKKFTSTTELQEVGKNGQKSVVEARQKKMWHIDDIIRLIQSK